MEKRYVKDSIITSESEVKYHVLNSQTTGKTFVQGRIPEYP
ncbi:hypothetical protein CLOSBL3_11825 [Clostridiaceae bacterium BL-3]|nr:hypothetical protein CLOSBL3_11825 [Clostridiaceae bacterium BL-3]